MFKGIEHLYLIKGKIVFRVHFCKNGEKKYIWKTLGRLRNSRKRNSGEDRKNSSEKCEITAEYRVG